MRHARRTVPTVPFVIAVLAGATIVAAGPSEAEEPKVLPVPRVVFTTVADSHGTMNGLAVVDLDGSEPRVLTDPKADGSTDSHVSPAIHPDGARLAYTVERWEGGPVVRFRDMSSGQDVAVGEGRSPVWSPDGRQLAYRRQAGDGAELVVRDVAGLVAGPARVVHRHSGPMFRPAWSPLGDRVAVYAQRSDASPWGGHSHDADVVVVDVAHGTSTVVSGSLSVDPTPLSWAPDGSAVAAVGRLHPESTGMSALLLPTHGSDPRVLLHEDEETTFGTRFSPDGSVVWAMAQQANGLVALSPTGGVVRRLQLSEARDDDQLLVAPDGRTAVVGMSVEPSPNDLRTDLFQIDLETGQGRRLTSGGQYAVHSAAAHWPGLAHRIGGEDRIETALELVRRVFDRVDCVVLARADDFADALAAGPLAASLDAPLLLTFPDRLDQRVADEIERLQARCAVLVGGVQALSEELADALRELGLDVDRIGGGDRFAVAAAIAERVGTDGGAYVVEGASDDPTRGWPDAIAVGGLAAVERRPILLTRRDELPPATASALERLSQPRIDVVGGELAVSRDVVAQMQDRGVTVTRIAGKDRYDTSRRITEQAVRAGLDHQSPVVVTGRAWPDALTAGVVAAATGRPLVLVDGADHTGGTATRDWIGAQAGDLRSIELIGGAAAIAPPVVTTIEEFAAPF